MMKPTLQSWSITNLARLLAQISGALVGLALLLLVGSAFQWITPVWWGGKALFPFYFGGTVLVVGSVPFLMMTCLVFALRSSSVGTRGFFFAGLIQGIALVPLSFIVMIVFRFYFYQGELSGLLPLWTALGVSGILVTIGSAFLVSALIGGKPPNNREHTTVSA